MSIETIGSVQSLLKSHQANNWTKPTRSKAIYLQSLNLWEKFRQKPIIYRVLGNSNEADTVKDADIAVQKLVTGENKNIHETLLAVEQAEIAFKTMNQIRTKVIDAYKEIMRMQV